MATTTVALVPDLTKVVFNPSKSVTFVPVAKKQQVAVEVTNNCTSDVAVKFKNTGPTIYKTNPPNCKLAVGEKKIFQCIFKGQPKEKCKLNERFTVVCIAASKNARPEKVWANAHKAATLKHKISILFQGLNDQKENETQQPTNNDDDEDKDRQARSKKVDAPKPRKQAIIYMFLRGEGESISDEDEDENQGTAPAAGAPSDDMRTTRPAGNFTGQVASNAAAGGAANPNSEFRTTRPAGAFTGQVASNETLGGGPPGGPISEFRTTRPAGNFTGQVATNNVPVAGTPVDPKSTGLRTTRPAGAFNNQVTPNADGGAGGTADLKTTKPAGSYENPQKPINK